MMLDTSASPRLTVLDNAKGVLIACVIFGHLIERFIDDQNVRALYLSIYSVHMPAFALLAGITTREPFDKAYFRRLAGSVLIPFIVFTIISELLEVGLYGDISNYTKTIQPYWLLWFLLSLACWRALLPLVNRLPGSIYVALLVSLIAGYVDSIDNFMGISRTIYFFPFFLIGYKLSPYIRARGKWLEAPKPLFVVILLSNLAFFYFLRSIPLQWVYGSMPYSVMHLAGPLAAAVRLLMYAVSFVSILAIFALVPRRESTTTRWGRGSLVTYGLHGLLVKAFIFLGLIDALRMQLLFFSLAAVAVITVTLVELLSSRYVQNPVRLAFNSISQSVLGLIERWLR